MAEEPIAVSPSPPAQHDPHFDALLHQVYGASLQPQAWGDALARIAESFNAPRALLYSFAPGGSGVSFAFAHNLPESSLAAYAALGADEDPFVVNGVQRGLIQEGRAALGQDLISTQELMRTEFYRRVWQPVGILHLCTGVVFDGTDPRLAPTVLALYRDHTDPPFDAMVRDRLSVLLRHVSRSLGVMFRLRDQGQQLAASRAAMDHLSSGVVMLAADQTVVFENRMAKDRLDAAQTVARRTDHAAPHSPGVRLALAPRLDALQGDLARLLADASRTDASAPVAHFSRALMLPAGNGQPHLLVQAAPLQRQGDWQPEQATAIVFLTDVPPVDIDPRRLEALFSLSSAEARAALQVLHGGSLSDMAGRLNVSANTLKTQLQAAYQKTDTHNQAELIRLLVSVGATRV
jgi:DNA-binding CsgD family transcriptional regulator